MCAIGSSLQYDWKTQYPSFFVMSRSITPFWFTRGTGFSTRSGVVKSLKAHCADPVSHGNVSCTFRYQSKRSQAYVSDQSPSCETAALAPFCERVGSVLCQVCVRMEPLPATAPGASECRRAWLSAPHSM